MYQSYWTSHPAFRIAQFLLYYRLYDAFGPVYDRRFGAVALR